MYMYMCMKYIALYDSIVSKCSNCMSKFRVLDATFTISRSQELPLANVPYHTQEFILNTLYQERMNPAEGAYNCYIKRCVNLCRTNCTKYQYMGKH